MKMLDLSNYDDRQFFYRSANWRYVREQKLEKNPVCEKCYADGIITAATDVHHIIDIDIDPSWDNAMNISGLQSLCHSCHSKITNSRKKPKVWQPYKLKFKI